MKRFIPSLPMALAAIMIASITSGCPDSNTGPNDPTPAGFILTENAVERVKQANGAVTGTIEIVRHAGTGAVTTPSGDLNLSFTKEDGTTWTTEAQDSVQITGYNDALLAVERDPNNKWGFRLLGKGGGETGITFAYYRGTKLLFTSRLIPVTIVAEGLDLAKMRIVTNSGSFVNITDSVTGTISTAWGTEPIPINIDYFNALGEVVNVWSDPNVTLLWEVSDTSKIDFWQDPDDATNFAMMAKAPGSATVSFTLKHDSPTYGLYTAFVTPPIAIDIH